MRFRYTVRVYTRTHAHARVLIASGHDVSCTYTVQYLVAGVGDSPTGDARAFCATYFGGERLAPCRAGVVCTVTETTHTTSRKENGGEEKGGGSPPCPPPPPPPLDPPLLQSQLRHANTALLYYYSPSLEKSRNLYNIIIPKHQM